MNKSVNELAPCGVYCGACPSFEKSCFGCSSETKQNTRTSRMGCKIRICCHTIKKVNYCAKCDQFPCAKVNQKLIKSHPKDPRFKYRHELPQMHEEFKKMGITKFLQHQKKRWTCPDCGGSVRFYHYKCSQCDRAVKV